MRMAEEGWIRRRLPVVVAVAMLLAMIVPSSVLASSGDEGETVEQAVEAPAEEVVDEPAEEPAEPPAEEAVAPAPEPEPAAEPAPEAAPEAPAPEQEAEPVNDGEKAADEELAKEPDGTLADEQAEATAEETESVAAAEEPTGAVLAAAQLDALQTTTPPEPAVDPVIGEHVGPVPDGCIRIDGEGPGTYSSDGVTVTIEVIDGSEYVSFVSDELIFQVIVKGGPYVYIYTYPEGTFSDEGLHAPLVGIGNIADVSYVQICFGGVLPPPGGEETPTVSPPETPTVTPVVSPPAVVGVTSAQAVGLETAAAAPEFLPFTGGPLAPIGLSSLVTALAGLALRRRAVR